MHDPDNSVRQGKGCVTGRAGLEQRISDWARPRMPFFAAEFLTFGLKQAWASLYAGIMLALIIGTKFVWHPEWAIARYDFLTIAAVVIQCLLLALKLETPREALVILIYHIVGTIMEIFKTHMGSWAYPEPGLLRIGGVPLFTGFMYACVGSYMVRVIRLFDMRFEPFPSFLSSGTLALAIYLNFFGHHYVFDFRYLLMAATLVLFARTRIYFTPHGKTYWMPLPLAAFLTTIFLWIAENIGTFTGTWLYPSQATWHLVGVAKMGSWYLLLFLSFVLVTLVHPARTRDEFDR